jgi:hypothetical protein
MNIETKDGTRARNGTPSVRISIVPEFSATFWINWLLTAMAGEIAGHALNHISTARYPKLALLTRSRLLTSLDAKRGQKPGGQLPDGRLTCAIAVQMSDRPARSCQSMRDCHRNEVRQKTHFASRLKWITPVQSCREEYFAFGFSEIDVS